jgi:hypothetical protein
MTKKKKPRVNIQEKFQSIATWLEAQDDTLSYGIRSASDAVKLYDHFVTAKKLPSRYADTDEPLVVKARIQTLGYDPMVTEQSKADSDVQPVTTNERAHYFIAVGYVMMKLDKSFNEVRNEPTAQTRKLLLDQIVSSGIRRDRAELLITADI